MLALFIEPKSTFSTLFYVTIVYILFLLIIMVQLVIFYIQFSASFHCYPSNGESILFTWDCEAGNGKWWRVRVRWHISGFFDSTDDNIVVDRIMHSASAQTITCFKRQFDLHLLVRKLNVACGVSLASSSLFTRGFLLQLIVPTQS